MVVENIVNFLYLLKTKFVTTLETFIKEINLRKSEIVDMFLNLFESSKTPLVRIKF